MDRSLELANAATLRRLRDARRRRRMLANRTGYAAVTALIQKNQKQFDKNRDTSFDVGFKDDKPVAQTDNQFFDRVGIEGSRDSKFIRSLPPNPVPDTAGHSLLLWDTAGFKGDGGTLEKGPLPRYAGLTSARQMAERQESANRRAEAIAAKASMEGLTLRTGIQDIRDVVLGIPHDLMNATCPQPLWTTCSKNNRLRGFGLLLLIAATTAVVVL